MPDPDCCQETTPFCPNITGCKLVNSDILIVDPQKRDYYLITFCHSGWETCKRYITYKTLAFCPPNIFPDSPFTIDEIIDQFDKNI